MDWNLGDLFDAVANVVPDDRQAIVQGEHIVTWGDFNRRTNRVARALLAAGLNAGDRVAFMMRNHPAYLEGFAACVKARLVHVNINYRYRVDEIAYVFKDCDVQAVLFGKEFEPLVNALREQFPGIALWVCVDGATSAALQFERLATEGDGSTLDIARSPDDALLLYTGGTTGMPKGVIWPAGRYRECQLESPLIAKRPANLEEHVDLVRAAVAPGRTIPACPLMHGAGLSSSLAELLMGGTVILLPSSSFQAEELWDEAAKHKATRILIVGDVFAKPMLQALDREPGRYALNNLRVISSAGLLWSYENKQGLLAHLPTVVLADNFGASEASGLGYSITSSKQSVPTGQFISGPQTVLITDDGKVLGPGVPGEGMIARGEPLPEGYFGDPKKTAEVFRIIDGKRYSMPGDWARRDENGLVQLVGRGSLVINTGGEKVFVEEVEEVLKQLPGVQDALVVAQPDETWGSIVVALVQPYPGATIVPAVLQEQVATRLAGYKMPRVMLLLESLPRSDAGKADYKTAKSIAAELISKGRQTGLHR